MKSIFLIAPIILLNGRTSTLLNTAISAAHTGTNIYCGSLTEQQRMAFRDNYNQDSAHQLSIQCHAKKQHTGADND